MAADVVGDVVQLRCSAIQHLRPLDAAAPVKEAHEVRLLTGHPCYSGGSKVFVRNQDACDSARRGRAHFIWLDVCHIIVYLPGMYLCMQQKHTHTPAAWKAAHTHTDTTRTCTVATVHGGWRQHQSRRKLATIPTASHRVWQQPHFPALQALRHPPPVQGVRLIRPRQPVI